MKRQTKARAWTLQILYAREMQGSGSLPDIGELFLARHAGGEETKTAVRRRLAVLEERLGEIDALLTETITNWEFHRLAAIDRNVLRLAACELLAFREVPFKVVIDEAVNLARRYGGDESPRFVNGVLDALRIRLGSASTSA